VTAFSDIAAGEQADAERHRAAHGRGESGADSPRLLPISTGCAAPSASILPPRSGGDYDVLRLADGTVAFLIADVSGKGTSAAFYAAETKGDFAALDKLKLGPREVAARINEIWWESHPRSLFMTLAYGRFDPHSGAFSFIRAGHPPAFLRRADARVERLQPQGMGVGLSLDRFLPGLELCEGRLEAGDALVFFTDGLTEAQDGQGSFYGEDRLRQLLGLPKSSSEPAADVKAFTSEEPLRTI
jgi:serine phosphatase RsbU (regulator of sigma subunit)